MIEKAARETVSNQKSAQGEVIEHEADKISSKYNDKIIQIIESKQNPIRILVSIILRDEEPEEKKLEKHGEKEDKKKLKPTFGVMVEATKAIKNLSKTEAVIETLM